MTRTPYGYCMCVAEQKCTWPDCRVGDMFASNDDGKPARHVVSIAGDRDSYLDGLIGLPQQAQKAELEAAEEDAIAAVRGVVSGLLLSAALVLTALWLGYSIARWWWP